ncbi:MAG: ABC transporter ATP-binding protein [Actinomycetales bacterium]|nr:ABC transporter ATP-binding protein [Actinomycetales bacterium]
MSGAGLAASLHLARGDFRLDLDLDIAPGQVVALLGPNGSGKTTTLHTLAGLLRLRRGRVALGGQVLDDPEAGVFVAPERRDVGVVFQDYLLFPHLSAVDNVAFGLRARGVARREATSRAREWLDRVGVGAHASSRPAGLSGGQAQRVALARALVAHPRLLLLDEPLAALDAATRLDVRSELARHLRDFDGAALMITHDPLDAMAIADRIVVIEDGRVVQDGAPAMVARAPRTDYVARLVGLNLLRGVARAEVVDVDGGGEIAVSEEADGRVLVSFPPTSVTLHRHAPEGSARNAWEGRIAGMDQHAHTMRVLVEAPGRPSVLADVTVASAADLALVVGARVWLSFKATDTHVYPG